MFRRQHPGKDRVMRTFDARNVEESRTIADENAAFGTDCQPPSEMARAPYDSRLPPSSTCAIAGCVLNRWNSSNGDRVGFV
jgi:hypothetical protein